MPRRLWRSLDGPYVAPDDGATVDLRGTTTERSVEERKQILLQNYYGGLAGLGSYTGGWNAVTTAPGRPWTFDRGVREAYQRVPWVHACVRVIALSQSGLRFGVKDNYKPVGQGASEIDDDPLIPLLNVRANPIEYAYQLRKRVSMQWMLSPRGGFLEAVPFKSRRTGISEFRLLPASRTRIVPDKSGNIDHFEVDPPGGIGKVRPVPTEQVRWFREEHPDDPYAGLTPLEAAGLSIEMDYFARLFNRQFMANDGRPGGIVAVTSPDGKGEPADEDELDRIERKFGGGPADAGRLVVIDGTVSYVDPSKSARDLQWKDGRLAARDEVFGVFLVPVSAIDSSNRTFSNAGQEWINYWTLMGVPHGDAFAWLFHDDALGVPFLDYSKVEALQEVARQNRAEWRDEVEQGMRTPLRYAMDTGQSIGEAPGDFPDQPGTRSLWLPAGKVPVALTPDEQVQAEKLAPVGSGTQAAPMSAGAADGGGDGGGAGGGGVGPDGGPPPDGGGGEFKGTPRPKDRNLAKLALRRARESGRLRVVGDTVSHGDDDEEDHRDDAAEAALTSALTSYAHRQVGVVLARVRGTKARMGTRHWVPRPGEPVSTKQLDANDVVDEQQWQDQAQQVADETLRPLARGQLDATAQQAVAADATGHAGVAALLGITAASAVPSVALGLLDAELVHVTGLVAASAAALAVDLARVVRDAEAADAARVAAGGAPAGTAPVASAVQQWAQGIGDWVASVAPTSAAQAIEAGKHAVLSPLGGLVERTWRTKRDDKVRAAHADAEGQVARGGEPFVVGGEQLRYPRDPLGTPGNTINCRCRARWRVAVKRQPDVVAKVLAMPTPLTYKYLEDAVAVGDVHAPRWALRLGAARVEPGPALEGVAGRDHLAEMLEGKARGERHVRTRAGEHEFHLPIGAPIVAHPHLAGVEGRDHVAEIAGGLPSPAPAAMQLPRPRRTAPIPNGTRAVHEDGTAGRVEHVRTSALRAGDRLVNPVTGAHAGTVTSVRWGTGFSREADHKTPLGVDRQVHVDGDPRVVTPQATFARHVPDDAMPDAAPDAGATGDMAKAKAELASKGQDVLGLLAKGMTAQEAEKEYARLLHNARFRYRRERLKAEKAGVKQAAKAVDADVAQGPKQTLGSVGEQLLKDPTAVDLDKALKAEAGTQPKALYTGAGGPGAVGGSEQWFDKLTADTETHVPVVGLNLQAGYVVKHGVAIRRGGVAYLIETAGPEPTPAELARIDNAAKVYDAVLGGIPAQHRGKQRGVALITGRNPKDALWAKKYKTPGFQSLATAALGGTTWWGGASVNPGTAAHEYGHNLDSQLYEPYLWASDLTTPHSVDGGEPFHWQSAVGDANDGATSKAWAPGGELHGKFHETRPGGHPITPGKPHVTDYAGNASREDFAESTRLYLKDRREGKLGYLSPETGQTVGVNVRFADLWPARARALDAMLGLQSDYDTQFVKAQQEKAAQAYLANRIDIHEAVQQQGSVPENIGLEDVMRRFGLSDKASGGAWQLADTRFKAHLDSKNKGDALEHAKETWTMLATLPDDGDRAAMIATLEDGFQLPHGDAVAVVGDALTWKKAQLASAEQEKAAGEAKLAAEQSVQDVLSLSDLPKQLQTVIRKRRANVKLRAKQKGASPEQAEAIAAAYEAEQVAKEAKNLGIDKQLGPKVVTLKVAKDVKGHDPGPLQRIHSKWSAGSKGAKSFLTKAGATPAPHAKNAAYWGKPQQAKSNIAGTLGHLLNNESDWEVFRAYRNSGAHMGHHGQFDTTSEKIKSFDAYTEEQRQGLLDAEVSQRISMWASTSGDTNPFAIMMQQAVKDELGVPGPVGVVDAGGSTKADIEKRYPVVSAFYRRFVRVQYEQTQRELEEAGVEWMPLYRGMRIEKGKHSWAEESDGSWVPLQPASSFSTAPNVSARFSGYGSSRMMIRGMVHRSMILGSSRTGFGCLNEKEYVVLAPTEEEAAFQVRFGVQASKEADWNSAFAKKDLAPAGDPPWGTAQDVQTWSSGTLLSWWNVVGGPAHIGWRKVLADEYKRRGLSPPVG